MLGAENRSSSGDAPNKSELGLALEGCAIGFVVFGLEENSSSSACSLPNKSASFSVVAGLSDRKNNKKVHIYCWHLILTSESSKLKESKLKQSP